MLIQSSFFPRILHYISIPVVKNAPLLAPKSSSNRWPVMIFSHGLGGSRNAYSHLVGSIASHGVIVIATEHRDGSTPISYVREVPSEERADEKPAGKHSQRAVDYKRISHTVSPSVEEERNAQLKIRLWELGLIHDSLLKIDDAKALTNLNSSSVSLSMFNSKMDVHNPGKITFAGHSFGGATITQFVKSTFYSPETSQAPPEYTPLFTPSSRSSIAQQITPQTPVVLLDVWCMPLRAATVRWLWNKPFPCYTPTGPGGAALVAVESQAFFKWREHLKATKRLLSPDPSQDSLSHTKNNSNITGPNFFYADSSAHLSQSDFGMLFPWVVKKVFAAEEPERIMRLNVRAILQVMRNSGITVSETSRADMEMEGEKEATKDDTLIFGQDAQVRGWNWLDTNVDDLRDVDIDKSENTKAKSQDQPMDAVVNNEVMKQSNGTVERL